MALTRLLGIIESISYRFCNSTKIIRYIYEKVRSNLCRISLELQGKSESILYLKHIQCLGNLSTERDYFHLSTGINQLL